MTQVCSCIILGITLVTDSNEGQHMAKILYNKFKN